MSDCPAEQVLDRWQVAQYPAKEDSSGVPPDLAGLDWIDAEVPGAVQYDLVRAGQITNPFAGTQAARDAGWVAQSDWCYRTTFTLSTVAPGHALDLPGVDTFADVWLNGTLVGQTSSNYRAYRFPLDPNILRAGENELLVRVKAHRRMVAEMIPEAAARLATTNNAFSFGGKSLIRRYQRNFFSGNSSLLNLGAEILGIGINKPVTLTRDSPSRIRHFHFQVESVSEHLARVRVSAEIARDGAPAGGVFEAVLVDPDSGRRVAEATSPFTSEDLEVRLEVVNPRLWWPRGYGEPALYRLELRILEGSTVVSTLTRRVGLKRVELLSRLPSGRKTFQFVVNGVPVHVRGHNIIPLDYIKVHGSPAEYLRLLRLVTHSNANLIRIWGGGANEPELFYDACDELGIMLWQDYYLHSTVYPDYDPAFVEEFRSESLELGRWLRNHACLSLLCGGNEQDEGWDEWGWQGDLDAYYGKELAYKVAAEVAAEAAPEIPFIPNSPHGSRFSQSPVDGDMHCWGNFYNATKDPVFVTETCWNLQSYSRPETLRETMGLDIDEFNDLRWPARWKELTGLALVTKLPYSACHASRTLRDYLYGLEVEHLEADRHALGMLRLRSSSCRGIVYWPINKGGPLFEFGCVDYAGRPLMNFYGIRRLYADIAVSVYRDVDAVRVVASNLSLQELRGSLRLTRLDASGKLLEEHEMAVFLRADDTGEVLSVPTLYQRVGDRTRELVQVQLRTDAGTVIAQDTLFFCPIAEFDAEPGPLGAQVEALGAGRWSVELTGTSVVKLLQLEADGLLFTDNYFTLVPGEPRTIEISQLLESEQAVRTLSVSAMGTEEHLEIRLP